MSQKFLATKISRNSGDKSIEQLCSRKLVWKLRTTLGLETSVPFFTHLDSQISHHWKTIIRIIRLENPSFTTVEHFFSYRDVKSQFYRTVDFGRQFSFQG